MSTYLVQYGRSAFVGWFRFPAADCEASLRRGDRVVIRGPRGLELGTILCEPSDRFSQPAADGDLVRAATPDDSAAAQRAEVLAADILAEAAAADMLSLTFVDAEVSLDRSSAIVHAIPWAECDASPFLQELSSRFGLTVRLLDLSRVPASADPASGGCGKPGCGSASGGCDSCGTGGGCSTGSCSRGKVKTADDLTAYFADLRRQMESDLVGRTPLA